MQLKIIPFVVVLSLLLSCKKDKNDVPVAASNTKGLDINIKFNIDGMPLIANAMNYTNAASINYSISRLQFYVSDFRFETVNGSVIKYDSVFYIDAFSSATTSFGFPGLPFDNYRKLQFYVGLDSVHNVTGALANTVENSNMAWPDAMGGGYHFMKLEGYFISGTSTLGYAMHLGKNRSLVAINIVQNFSVNETDKNLELDMNINEWFTHPLIYNFKTDGVYSMSDSAAMTKLALNGVDVFQLN